MSSEQKISAKPKIYQLTDIWFPKILVFELSLVWIYVGFFFQYGSFTELIQAILAPLIMPAFAFAGMRFLLPGFLKNKSFNDTGRKFVIGFFWLFWILSHSTIVPATAIQDKEIGIALIISMISLSISLGVSLGSDSFFESLDQNPPEIETEK